MMFFQSLFLCLLAITNFSCVHSSSTPPNAKIKPSVSNGIVVDAGSGGSRLHVYTWKARRFTTAPPPLSYPEGNELWTARMSPGIAQLADDLDSIGAYLAPLITFAKQALIANKDSYGDIPIYFYATGGVRLLSAKKRDEVIDTVRDYLNNDTNCPFFFHEDFARVISGEEEAIFSWAATNFLMGTLLSASQGEGVVQGVNSTYGTIDLGGASTQIAYFLPSQDILEGLYKFQIGNQKIWNVYTKSFLSFGVNSARERHLTGIVDKYLDSVARGVYDKVDADVSNSAVASNVVAGGPVNVNPATNTTAGIGSEVVAASHRKQKQALQVVNSCFYAGYSEKLYGSDGSTRVEVMGPELPMSDQLHRCMDAVRPLMEMKHNKFCEQVYHGDCSIAGSYQPPLPNGVHGKFIGTSSLLVPWKFLMLPNTASLALIKSRASSICQMSFDDIMFYYEVNFVGASASYVSDQLPYFCFLSSYVIVLLEEGYRFRNNQTLTVVEQVNGNRMGWALGAILYEINHYPWEMVASPHNINGANDDTTSGTAHYAVHSWLYLVLAAIVGLVVGAVAAVFVYREVTDSSYRRLPTSDIESDTYDNIQRVSTVELLRRRGAGQGQDGNSRYDSPDRGLAATSAHTPLNSSKPASSSNSGTSVSANVISGTNSVLNSDATATMKRSYGTNQSYQSMEP